MVEHLAGLGELIPEAALLFGLLLQIVLEIFPRLFLLLHDVVEVGMHGKHLFPFFFGHFMDFSQLCFL